MRIICLGNIYGNVHLINEYLYRSKADFALICGNISICGRNKNKYLPKSFNEKNNFYEYLEGKQLFIKPVFSIRGIYDDFYLVKKLIERDINIHNFRIIEDGTVVKYNNIAIGGYGGTYSPLYYKKENLIGYQKKHFNEKEVNSLTDKIIDILLVYDLIGGVTKKKIEFSEETLNMFIKTQCLYCLIGINDWWGLAPMPGKNVISLPKATEGYLIIEPDKEWRAEGVRFDVSLNRHKRESND